MGGQQSVDENSSSICINHPKFNQAELLRNDQVVRICFNVENESDVQEWEKKLTKITRLDDEVLLLPKTYRYTRRAICSSSGSIYIDFDKYTYLLEDELRNRRKMSKYFEEQELWYLLFSLVTAARNFKSIGSKIGDVRPLNIFINREGQVKVSNMLSWPREPSNYIKTAFENQKTYIAPEEVAAIHQSQQENYIDKYRAESFSIGLTLLETAMLRDMSSVYADSRTAFDEDKLIYRLRNWWSHTFKLANESTQQFQIKSYSDALKLTVAGMCQIDPVKRLTSEQVQNWLKPFAQPINDLKPVNKGMPPVKNAQKYRNMLTERSSIPVHPRYEHNPSQRVPFRDKSGARQLFNKYAGINHSDPAVWTNPQKPPEHNQLNRHTAYSGNQNAQNNRPQSYVQNTQPHQLYTHGISLHHQNAPITKPNQFSDQTWKQNPSQYNQTKFIFPPDSKPHQNISNTRPTSTSTSVNGMQYHNFPQTTFIDIPSPNPQADPLVKPGPSFKSTNEPKFASQHHFVPQEDNMPQTQKQDDKTELTGNALQHQKSLSPALNTQSDILRKIDEQLEASKRNY